jgi:hypothetical protein
MQVTETAIIGRQGRTARMAASANLKELNVLQHRLL